MLLYLHYISLSPSTDLITFYVFILLLFLSFSKTDSNENNYEIVHGHVHQGMHKGAIGMLDYYGLRESLVSLAERGYMITVVGHSLGAGKKKKM